MASFYEAVMFLKEIPSVDVVGIRAVRSST